MRCTRCNGLYARRWDVESRIEEVFCVNCGAIPVYAPLPAPPEHGLVKERRQLAEDPFVCACGNGKNPERKRCKPCNMKLAYDWRKKVKEERARLKAATAKEFAV